MNSQTTLKINTLTNTKMNEILKQYIQDNSIPIEKRRAMAQDLDSGAIDEQRAVGIITTKYKGKYGSTPPAPKSNIPQPKPIGELMAEQNKTDDIAKQYTGATGKSLTESVVDMQKQGRTSALSETGKNIVSGVAAIPGAIWNSTVKPIGDLTNTVAGTTLASGQGILGGLSSLNPADFKPQEFEKRFKKGLTSPTAIGTNPYKADKKGNVDVEQSVRNLAGDTLKGGAGVFNLATLVSGGGLLNQFKSNALAGASLSAGEDIKNNNDLASTGLNALISGGLQGAFAKAPGALKAGRKGLAKVAGLSDSSIDLLQNPQLGQKVLSELPGAEAALRDETLNNPLQKVGQEVFKPAVSKLSQQNKELGKQLGNVLKSSTVTSTLKTPYTAFTSKLKDLGANITKNGIEFDEFSPIDSASDVKQLQSIFSTLSKYKKQELPVPKIHDLTRKIDNILDYSSKTANPVSTPAESALKEARKALSELVKTKVPESRKLFEQISGNYETLDFFNPKLGENASSAGILKSIFSPQRKDELLPMIKGLEKSTGQQIVNPTKIAKATMEIAGDTRGDTLLEVAKNPNVRSALQALARKIVSPKGMAKDIVRLGQGKGLTRVLPQGLTPKGAAVSTAVSNALISLLGTRKNKK